MESASYMVRGLPSFHPRILSMIEESNKTQHGNIKRAK